MTRRDPEEVSGELTPGYPYPHPHTGVGEGGGGETAPCTADIRRPSPASTDVVPSRDWTTMTRHDFNTDAGPPVLFELTPGQAPTDDGSGTGSLLELLEP